MKKIATRSRHAAAVVPPPIPKPDATRPRATGVLSQRRTAPTVLARITHDIRATEDQVDDLRGQLLVERQRGAKLQRSVDDLRGALSQALAGWSAAGGDADRILELARITGVAAPADRDDH